MEVKINDRVRAAIFSAYHGKCQYCGKIDASSYHIDHIVPVSKGGDDNLLNYTLSCHSCNLRKSALSLPEAGIFLLLAIAEGKYSKLCRALSKSRQEAKIAVPSKSISGSICVLVDGYSNFFIQANSALFFALRASQNGHRVDFKPAWQLSGIQKVRYESLINDYYHFTGSTRSANGVNTSKGMDTSTFSQGSGGIY